MGKLPEGWEDYSNVGTVVEGTNFIAFKVPLSFHHKWNLFELKKSVPELTGIIDLTATKKYYKPETCKALGIKYRKIAVPGGGMVPGESFVQEFYDAVADLSSDDDGGLIGVHCTHGLNRTGYMVCRLVGFPIKCTG